MENKEKTSLQKAWVTSAKEDLATAKDLLKLGRYSYVLFFCHLALEKILKALYIKVNDNYPPPTHKLAKLAKDSKLNLTNKQIAHLNEISTFQVEARYDVIKDKIYKKATKEYTTKYLNIVIELVSYLLKKL